MFAMTLPKQARLIGLWNFLFMEKVDMMKAASRSDSAEAALSVIWITYNCNSVKTIGAA
jgi:hypothetical protein